MYAVTNKDKEAYVYCFMTYLALYIENNYHFLKYTIKHAVSPLLFLPLSLSPPKTPFFFRVTPAKGATAEGLPTNAPSAVPSPPISAPARDTPYYVLCVPLFSRKKKGDEKLLSSPCPYAAPKSNAPKRCRPSPEPVYSSFALPPSAAVPSLYTRLLSGHLPPLFCRQRTFQDKISFIVINQSFFFHFT